MHTPQKFRIAGMLTVGLVACDFFSKRAAFAWVARHGSWHVGNFFSIDALHNTALAGRLGTALIVVATVLVLLIIGALWLHARIPWWIAALLFAGVIGNSIDRLVYGAVVDWMSLGHVVIWNFADVFLWTGMCGIVLAPLRR